MKEEDENVDEKGIPNSYQRASTISKIFFLWPYRILRLGKEKILTEDDLEEILEEERSDTNLRIIEDMWSETMKKYKHAKSKQHDIKPPTLHKSIIKDYYKSHWFWHLFVGIGIFAKLVQGIALGNLVQYLSSSVWLEIENDGLSTNGYFWASLVVVCGLVTLFEHHHVFFVLSRKGMQLRVAGVAAVYAKSHRLSSLASIDDKNMTQGSGSVMNLVSNDVERFILASLFSSYLIWGPLAVVAVLIVGLQVIGVSFLSGFALVLITAPLQYHFSRRFAHLRLKIAKVTDKRMNWVSQAVSGARVVKMSGWETQFHQKITETRALEARQIQKANRLRAINQAISFASSIVMSIIIFVVDVHVTKQLLTPRKVFTIMTLINIAQLEVAHFSLAVMAASECYVSITRISNFLNLPELHKNSTASKDVNNTNSKTETNSSLALKLSNVTCFWNFLPGNNTSNPESGLSSSQHVLALSDINLDFNMNELYCVIGSVGSGKSALLQAISQELPHTSGFIKMYNDNSTNNNCTNIAYAPQEPFLLNGTIKENILMGKSIHDDSDKEWYNSIVNACGLNVDFEEQFHDGDLTIVGDRGVQCSGGQRARIGLARALYRAIPSKKRDHYTTDDDKSDYIQAADIILLDDPLSAVDSAVSKLIFYKAIKELCIERLGKCVVLATHQHQFISESKCILMSRGKVKCVGSWSDCLDASEGDLMDSMHHSSTNDLVSLEAKEKKAKNSDTNSPVLEEAEETLNKNESSEIKSNTKLSSSKEDKEIEKNDKDDHKEVRTSGIVQTSTYLKYIKSMGGWLVVFGILFIYILAQVSLLYTIVKIGEWSELETYSEQSDMKNTVLILTLMAGVAVFTLSRCFLGFYFAIKASQNLHDNMLESVLRSKIEFFDCNPLGRILNRFAADVGIIDDMLPQTLVEFLVYFFMILGAIATTAVVIPFILVLFPPLLMYFLSLRSTFLATSREIKRMEGIARSPMYAMLSENLNGISTIRANSASAYFTKKFEECQNQHSKTFWIFTSSSRWLGFRLDFIMWFILTFASFLAVVMNERKWLNINASVLGLALMSVIQLSSLFQWCVRQSAELVNQMVSVERLLDFSSLPSEAPLERKNDKTQFEKNWPSKGSIEIRNLTLRYRESLPPSLKDINIKIEGGQKIGVVGRTGSGKSTLMQGIFRLLEGEKDSQIKIDGVDISTLGLHLLRTQMSVIPQSPILFNGSTIRENLDPFNKYSTETIERALKDVQMLKTVQELPDKLDSLVAEGGSNFSVGQKQLLCLARAILRKNRILVLDEPSANVDRKTDELLQIAVQRSFPDSTIIAVAHRLDTIIEYDRILVLGYGEVLEYGSAYDLLQKEGEDAHFKSMVKDTGELMAAELHQRAKLAHTAKTQTDASIE